MNSGPERRPRFLDPLTISPTGARLTAAGVPIALALGLAGAFALQPPLTVQQGPVLVRVLLDVVWPFVLTAAAAGLGTLVSSRLHIDTQTIGARAIVAVILGWAILAFVWFALGAIGWQSPTAALVVLIVATIAGAFGLPGWWRDVKGFGSSIRHGANSIAGWFTGVILGMQLILAVLPPTTWDALVYHLALPQRYLEAGTWRLETGLMFSGMPQQTEMLYGMMLGARGAVAAQVLGWLMGVVAMAGLTVVAAHVFGAGYAFWPAAVLVSAPTVAATFHWAYAEPLGMACSAALLVVLVDSPRAPSWRLDALAGVLAGLAFGTKYTAGMVAVFGLIWLVASRGRGAGRSVVVYLAAAGAVAAPWLIKNAFLTGSPVYPLFFPAAEMTAARQAFYNHNLTPVSDAWTAVALFAQWALRGREAVTPYDATLGPLWLILPGLALISWRRLELTLSTALRPLVFGLLGVYALWVAALNVSPFLQQARLFFPLLVPTALLAGGGVAGLASWDVAGLRVTWLSRPLLALALGICAIQQGFAFSAQHPLDYLSGQLSMRDYQIATLGDYALAVEQINALPSGNRVMFLWEPRTLSCAPADRCEADELLDNWLAASNDTQSAQATIAHWRALGYDHVLISEYGSQIIRRDRPDWVSASTWAAFDDFRALIGECESFGGTYSLCVLPAVEAQS